jgi:hypothetical protein
MESKATGAAADFEQEPLAPPTYRARRAGSYTFTKYGHTSQCNLLDILQVLEQKSYYHLPRTGPAVQGTKHTPSMSVLLDESCLQQHVCRMLVSPSCAWKRM